MKRTIILLLCTMSTMLSAQFSHIQYMRPNDQNGLNIFEESKMDSTPYSGLKVKLGGDFALQFQGLNQSNNLNNLVELGNNLNLPTANLNLDVQLLDGVRMHLRTYLSSRHHNESWIKGGHLTIDKLDFIKPGFLKGFMNHATLTLGLDEFNYGDAHYRRSDNARAIYNPFVGNYIMDAFSTEAFGELTIQNNGLLVVLGVTNGKINQSVVVADTTDDKPSIYGKLGFDKQFTKNLRIRLTGSAYYNKGATTGKWLYGGDRAGSRYYSVLHTLKDANGNSEGTDFDGRFNAGFTQMTALQINPFFKFKGLELFGIYEMVIGDNVIDGKKEGSFTQIGAEMLIRFGKQEKFYLGGRYNTVNGKRFEGDRVELEILRYNVGGGWYISKNILAKAEYVNQEYKGAGWDGRFEGAKFSGFNIEAVVSF
ncbi:MAG: hypothetical protein IPO45_00510 [Saprospiraceae bacterium]|jgi:hypothetical protein|uniref:hypothetical protein n=1 Tax=Candidatus Brachybacter algidus TaxID=2982024 RepID=UPI001B51639F|nr:hypothetical protein [Candidatus Brachybacter algidus]MBP7306191.1 hypothetical protein [Saprospiraceae bacterium]MBK7604477.1 hypothetical protein [Candidatus Brachybacter algidus]MBK8355350.1 hypothetical protein [Candidatus Brachybacter algidus]MBK9550672.1 hypothetical protein [Candidatus Brachybacter algidus]MBP7539885.1 hypothetical protein [Saprospiraceae bacterium]